MIKFYSVSDGFGLNSQCKNYVVSLVSLHVNRLFKHIPGSCSSKVNKQFTLQWPHGSILTYGKVHVQYKSFPQVIILNWGQCKVMFSSAVLQLLLTASPCSQKAFFLLPLLQFPLHVSTTVGLTMKPFFSLFCVCVFCLLSCRRRKAGILPSLEDLLFYTIAEGQEKIPAHKFTTVSPLEQRASLRIYVCHD